MTQDEQDEYDRLIAFVEGSRNMEDAEKRFCEKHNLLNHHNSQMEERRQAQDRLFSDDYWQTLFAIEEPEAHTFRKRLSDPG
jgi:hypothetical protein